MPLVRSTPPNMPPAPVMRITEQTGPSADSSVFSSAFLSIPRRRPSMNAANSSEMSSATGVSPMVRSTWYQAWSLVPSGRIPPVDAALRPVFMKMRFSGSSSTARTVPNLGGFDSACSSAWPRIEGIGSTNFLPIQIP